MRAGTSGGVGRLLTVAALALALPPVAEGQTSQTSREAGGNQREVWGMSYSTLPGGKAVGKCFPIHISVTHQGGQAFRVGIFESEVGGGGPSWRASGWMAAMMAAQLVGFDPASTQISYDVAGHADGPSAGGLITVGTIAALRGDTVRQDAAMTGTINPDGTIGPVGGIPQKLEGAAAAGKKLVLIPADVRLMHDSNQDRMVDLIEHGKALGLEVRPVIDIFTAYEILTGKALPRPPKARPPQLSEAAYDHNQRKSREWAVRAQVALDQYANLPDTHKYEFGTANVQAATTDLERIENFLNEGEAARAYQASLDATTAAVLALEATRLNETYQSRSLDQAAVQVKSLGSAAGKLDLILAQIKRTKPKTVGQVAALINAQIALSTAISQSVMAKQLLDEQTDDEDKRLGNVFSANDYYQYALLNAETAKDALEALPTIGGRPLADEARAADAAELFLHAAQANENVLDKLVIESIAESVNLRAEVVRANLMRKDIVYGLNRLGLGAVLPTMLKQLGTGPAGQFARLAAAVDAYTSSSVLLAKYYTLKSELDDDLGLKSIQYETALQNMLDAAEDGLSRSVQALARHDIDASTCAEYYQLGRMYRDRSQVAKLDALNMFWRGQAIAWVLSQLAGTPLAE